MFCEYRTGKGPDALDDAGRCHVVDKNRSLTPIVVYKPSLKIALKGKGVVLPDSFKQRKSNAPRC